MSEKQQLLFQNENKIIEYDNIIYLINEEENTAGVIGCEENLQHIHIPRSVKQGTKEFNITRIMENAFESSRIESIQFSSDSKLETIDKNAFSFSTIKSIIIPSSVTLIGEGAFSDCEQLEVIEIPNDSKLKTIDNYAFYKSEIKSITIPSSVTLIGEGAFYNCYQLKVIEIPNDSKLKTIDKYAFFYTKINTITIPSELVDLKEGWCRRTFDLTKIIVSPNNPRYCLYEDNMILGKTINESNNYENLIFCCRNIEHIKLPNFIKHICSYSFSGCIQLETIEIPNDSKLETIDKEAFSFSTIKSIIIPSSVTLIGEGAFSDCDQLEVIEIPNDSKLKTIDSNTFFNSNIKSITIPSELVDLKEGWCSGASNLTKIIVSPNNPRYCLCEDNMILGKTINESNNYENLIFCCRKIKHIKIPNFIKHICSYSFSECYQLETIEIPNDSKLETIDIYAFSFSSIKSIRIPSSVTLIGEDAFFECEELEVIEIPNDSKLKTIDKDAFSSSAIMSITIPSELVDLKEGWCNDTPYLTEIIVSPNNPRYCLYEDNMILGKMINESNNYENLIFCCRNIKHIKLPNFIKHICSYSFQYCDQLETIEIPNDSKLETIDKEAFSVSKIKSIRIPSSVTLIGEGAFSDCDQLEVIEIPNDSKLEIIDKEAFSNSKIKSIIIPSSVTLIGEDAFSHCKQLQIIEINNKEMISMCQSHFEDCVNAILMIPVDF